MTLYLVTLTPGLLQQPHLLDGIGCPARTGEVVEDDDGGYTMKKINHGQVATC